VAGGNTPLPADCLDPEALFVEGPIAPQALTACYQRFAANSAVGAELVFLGQVRADRIDAGTVAGIEYTAHRSMALQALKTVIKRVSGQIELIDVEVRHSLGYVPVGGASLLIAVATGHRDQAYRASRAILEAIKQEVPIYGREITTSRQSSWKVNR